MWTLRMGSGNWRGYTRIPDVGQIRADTMLLSGNLEDTKRNSDTDTDYSNHDN